MADKLTKYQITDNETGHVYQLEGPEGATDEELTSALEASLGGGVPSEPLSPYPEQPDAPVEAPLQPQGSVTMQNDGGPRIVPTTFEGAVANQGDVEAIEQDTRRLAYEDADQRVIVDAIRAGKSDDEVRMLGKQIAQAKGLGIIDITPQSIAEVREYLKKGGDKPIAFVGQQVQEQLLGQENPQVDPDVGYIGSALEKGMAYNPMGIATRLLQDWTDADLEGGLDKDALRQRYPDLDDNAIEGIHDALIGELRRREVSNAQFQTEARDVDPVTDFLGDIVGGSSPIDIFPVGRGATLPRRLAEGAGANIAVDAALQGQDISYGAQDEFSNAQSLVAGAAGAALQGAVEGVVRGAQFASSKIPSTPRISPVTYDGGQGPVSVVMADPKKTGRTKAAREEFANYNQSVVQAAADHINNTTAEWTNAPEFEVLQDFSGIDGIDKKAVAAIDPDGKVRVNMKEVLSQAKKAKVAPEDVLTAMTYHEALGHHGLASTFGTRLDAVMRSFYDNGTKDFKTAVNTWMEENPQGKQPKTDWIALATEEVLAEMSERGQIPVTLENRIKNVIKSFGRKMGMDLSYSTREIKTILGMAHAATIAGKKGDVPGNGYKYMNVGRKADNSLYERAKLSDARFLHAQGKSIEEVHAKTGWWRDQDGGWRRRLSDSDARTTESMYRETVDRIADDLGLDSFMIDQSKRPIELLRDEEWMKQHNVGALTVDEILDHPKLFEAYPFLTETPVTREKAAEKASGGALGSYDPDTGVIYISPKLGPNEAVSVLLHEIQHAIQRKEGWAKGGSPSSALRQTLKDSEVVDAVKKLLKDKAALSAIYNDLGFNFRERQRATAGFKQSLSNKNIKELRQILDLSDDVRYEAYEWLMGETEARETQALQPFNQEQLDRVPPGVGKAEGKDPDYLRKYMRSFKDPTKPDTSSGNFELEDDYRVTRDELSDIGTARKIVNDILENYEPQEGQTFAEQKRAARLMGLTSKQINNASKRGVNELSKRIFAANEIANKTNDELAALADQLGSSYINDPEKFTRLKERYTKKAMEHNALIATLFDMNSEAGRALAAIRAIDHSFKKYGELSDTLAQFDRQNILGGFANDDDFMKYVRLVSGLQQQGNPAGVMTAIRATVKPYWWQYILSFRHAMMLSGLATHAKNATDSALMIVRELEETGLAAAGFPIRKMMKAAGMKVEEGVSPQEVAGRAYGLLSAALDAKTYMEAADALMKGVQGKPISSKTEMSDAHIPVISKVTDFLHATDVFFRAFHNNANLYSLGVREARKDGYTGMAAFTEGSSRAHNPTLEMVKEAKRLADITLLVDAPSIFGELVEGGKKIRPGMKPGEQAQAFFANFLFPFFRVSDRLIFWAIRRAGPLAWFDRVTREDIKAGGARRDIAIARALYGASIIMSYWNAAGEGETEGAGPSKYAKQAALEGAGYLPNSVVSDEQYTDASALNLSLDPYDTQNATAANVASIRKAYDTGMADEEDTAKALAMAAQALGSTIASASFAENLSTYLDPFIARESSTKEGAAANLVANVATQFLPAAGRQINDMAIDPKVRDTTGDGSFTDKVKGRVMNSIPGLSDNLPQKYDVYGDEKEKGRTLLGLDNYQKRDQDPVGKELGRLERTTDKVVVSRAPSRIQFEGEDIKLDAEDKQEWQRVQGYYLREFMKEEMADPSWKTLSDEEKIIIVKDARKDAYDETKAYMLPLLGLEEEEEDEGSY